MANYFYNVLTNFHVGFQCLSSVLLVLLSVLGALIVASNIDRDSGYFRKKARKYFLIGLLVWVLVTLAWILTPGGN